MQNSKHSRPNYDDVKPLNPREASREPSTKRAEESISCYIDSAKKKSGSSSQGFRVQNSKHSRPNYDDVTPLNTRETSREPIIRRAEKKIACSRQREISEHSRF